VVAIEPEVEENSKITPTHVRLMLIGLIGTFALLIGPVDSTADANLTLHMFQHIGIIAFNIVFGYGLEQYLITRLGTLKRITYTGWKAFTTIMVFNTRTRGLVLAGLLPAIIIAYWHIPSVFDYAATNAVPHIIEHFSYIVAGNFIGLSIRAIPRKWKIILTYFGFMQAGMMGSMMLLWPHTYTVYSVAQNLDMDSAMMLFGAIGILMISSTLLRQLDII
jgi:cytochrome c oxidase assembly factor CtaG